MLCSNREALEWFTLPWNESLMRQAALPDVHVFTLAQLGGTHPEEYNVCKYSRNSLFRDDNSVF